MSDRIGVMNEGSLLQVGTPEQIYEHPTSRFVADFIGDINLFDVVVVDAFNGQTVRLATAWQSSGGHKAGGPPDLGDPARTVRAVRPRRGHPRGPQPDPVQGRLGGSIAATSTTTRWISAGMQFRVNEENRPESGTLRRRREGVRRVGSGVGGSVAVIDTKPATPALEADAVKARSRRGLLIALPSMVYLTLFFARAACSSSSCIRLPPEARPGRTELRDWNLGSYCQALRSGGGRDRLAVAVAGGRHHRDLSAVLLSVRLLHRHPAPGGTQRAARPRDDPVLVQLPGADLRLAASARHQMARSPSSVSHSAASRSGCSSPTPPS